MKQKAPNITLQIDYPTNFQIQVANGQLEKLLATATPKFEIGDNIFAEHFVVVKKKTGPFIGLHFLTKNMLVIHTTYGLIHFPHLRMKVKTASSKTTPNSQLVFNDDALMIPPTTTNTITTFVKHPSERKTTGIVTLLEKFLETASLLISHSMSTIFDKQITVGVTNTIESAYLIIKKKHRLQSSP